MTEQDIGIELMKSIKINLLKEEKLLDSLIDKINNGLLPTNNGLTILKLKIDSIIQYLCNFEITNLMKLTGKQFENDPTIDRLIEQRILLEKIRPLEYKLKNQISKYKVQVRTAANAIEDIDCSSSEDEEINENNKKTNVYRAPKVAQVIYPDGKDRDEGQIKKDARERRRYLESDMMTDALNEFTEEPDVFDAASCFKRKAQQKIRKIQKYEEENFTRLILSKKEKQMFEQVSTPGNLASELLNFRSLDAIGRMKVPSKNKKPGKFKGSKKRRR